MVDDDENGVFSGMRIGRRNLGKNLPQCHFVPGDLTWVGTQDMEVGS
jgi:hypothetical protein